MNPIRNEVIIRKKMIKYQRGVHKIDYTAFKKFTYKVDSIRIQ